MIGREDDDYDPALEKDIIPGDNSEPSDEKWPSNNDAPINLTKIPSVDTPTSKDMGGDGN